MSKSIKKAIVISVIIIITIIAIISTFFIVKNFGKESEIKSVKKNYLYNNIQDITVAEGTTKDDLVLKIDGENIVGTILIEKINFEGLVYEGTVEDTLDKEGIATSELLPYGKYYCKELETGSKYYLLNEENFEFEIKTDFGDAFEKIKR